MTDRTSIIEKIKALLSKTTDNGCTEGEMLSALDKAAAMRDAYDISDDELREAKADAAVLRNEPDPSDPHRLKWLLSGGVRQFCNVEIYRTGSKSGLKCIGLPSDADFAMWLLDSLADFVFGELYAHLIGNLAPKAERQIIIRSFVHAACDRINRRLLELVERSKVARTSNGRELVAVTNAAVKAFMKENNIRIRCCSGSGPSNVNEAAQAAGRAAGDRASFGRPVSGAAGVLRIGGRP
jgi:uncharacterized protein DUF2786